MEIIWKYFAQLSTLQREQLSQLPELYRYWNDKINVVSRKDIDHIVEHHILHSLAIAKFFTFIANQKILDIGTGGGFPGIPLAILFPNTHFTLVDSVGKKIKVVKEIAASIQLTNVEAIHARVEQLPDKFHIAVSRAVTDIPTLLGWINGKMVAFQNGSVLTPPSLITFKGDNVQSEIHHIKNPCKIYPIVDIFEEEFFRSKVLVQIEL
ncbi:MAG TPA: 16S rRNA (guanine(527)-N(7))-methyltransferase RsmG [Bacteroidales bacterium]|nr:16S rRNA (guanine(527)-N(7))-methyltransferase RsmG [Bacteroidales bacterium]HPO65843.1 16S rRNA (guanine(527)-N(7))-methyltransferase RsmG [Bacteroidales bacterium]